jgi:hypothetical protein
LRQRLGAAGRRQVEMNLSIERIAEMWESILR